MSTRRPARPRPRRWPAWLDEAVVYEVYPQSFQDGNGDGIGDLAGLIARLDHIRDLGCTAVWLNPCFASPFGDAGYDVSDFYRIAPRYGSNADFRRLCREAHRRGLRIILDLVAGHTSVEHPWFKAACRAERNQHSDWYIFTDTVWTDPGPGHRFVQGYGERDGSYLTNFFWFQPALNFGFIDPDPAKPWQQGVDAPGPRAVRREMRRIMEFWLRLGCDGFRVDMASSLVKRSAGGYAISGVTAFWNGVRDWFDREWPQAALISEWSQPAEAIPAGFHADFLIHFNNPAYNRLRGAAWNDERGDGAFLRAEGGDIAPFLEAFMPAWERTRETGLVSLPTGNHDIHRIAKLLDRRDLRVAYAMLFTMPGLPVVYYGDEIGMRHVPGLPSREGGYTRTGARTPMQWGPGRNAGFSSAPARDLYLPLDPDPARPTVAAQERDPRSLLSHVKRLLALRRSWPALGNRAAFAPLNHRGPAFAYRRGDDAVVAVNPGGQAAAIPVALPGATAAELVLGDGAALAIGPGGATVALAPRSWGVFRLS
ncbi:MAG: DUF3459 domain-containing protein [Planctomycetes bacterium]|nr:DUF3459 domain-containing protein [Planctomycetota bacterium]